MSRNRTFSILLSNVYATSNKARLSGNIHMAAQNAYWDQPRGLFWVNATDTDTQGHIFEGDVATFDGRGLFKEIKYTSSVEEIDYATPRRVLLGQSILVGGP